MDVSSVIGRASKLDKKNKNRKYGRTGRTRKHRAGQLCGMKNCYELQKSRYYDNDLKCYMAH